MSDNPARADSVCDDPTYLAILRLQRAYADISTRRAWSEMSSVAAADARFIYHTQSGVIEVQGADQFAGMGDQTAQRFSFNMLFPINSVVTECSGGRAKGRCYFFELAELKDSTEWLEVYGVYEDDYTQQEGGWRFSRREYRPLARRSGGRGESFPPHEVLS
jgi:SnoaL-like domain